MMLWDTAQESMLAPFAHRSSSHANQFPTYMLPGPSLAGDGGQQS